MSGIDTFASPRSAYLHIPFCHRRCFYCDFAVIPLGDKASGVKGPGSFSIQSYLKTLHREIAISPKGPPLATVYIGGGTPSLLSPHQISSLIEHLGQHFGIQDGCELTLEIDPATFSQDDLEGYVGAGINRFSLGGQSFEDRALAQLGRFHRSHHLIDACRWLNHSYKDGRLKSWSLDLIQNLPGQDLAAWRNQLQAALKTSVPHLSIYDLSIEPGTVFSWRQKRGELSLLNHDLAAEIALMTSATLRDAGFARYEISNYALPGHTSRHNRVYWSGAGWWGFGQGATSSPWGQRLVRPRTSKAYSSWVAEQEIIGPDSSLKPGNAKLMALDEQLMVGLRCREGVDIERLTRSWGWNSREREHYLKSLDLYWLSSFKRGWLKRCGNRIMLSEPNGMEISNQVLIEMIRWWESLPAAAVSSPNSEVLPRKVV